MVEETDENWRENVRKTIELLPDSVTIYQMEVPYNTGIYKEMKAEGKLDRARGELAHQARLGGLRFQRIGEGRLHRDQRLHRRARSAEDEVHLSRCALERRGSDRPRRGVVLAHRRARTSKTSRNSRSISKRSSAGELPISRAMTTTEEERMIREFILQMKLGRVSQQIFPGKIRRRMSAERFRQQFDDLHAQEPAQRARRLAGAHARGAAARWTRCSTPSSCPQHRGPRYV